MIWIIIEMFKQHLPYLFGKDWWHVISQDEKQAIEKGSKELQRGKGIPDEEVRQKIRQQLSNN